MSNNADVFTEAIKFVDVPLGEHFAIEAEEVDQTGVVVFIKTEEDYAVYANGRASGQERRFWDNDPCLMNEIDMPRKRAAP